ncbi:collagen-like protein [Costertonia aggregata]|uniref:Collagen-like protein n=1 Tax=Costertonia aggregata TaxID=343403 RepID=A0A7H9ATJ5_9FLAO|nr:collagen-like protein [Costertonia aggregata]QLG46525.1 collagen-like protein [Costertonia aggregata]
MRKITKLFSIIGSALLLACSGSDGRDGIDGIDGVDGIDGEDGVNILGTVVDIQNSFTLDNDYGIFYEFPDTIEVFEGDVVLVYMLFDELIDENGETFDVWRLLPQTRLVEQGILQYNYEYTILRVDIFLESDFDPELLLPADVENQVFRIAVVPADLAASSKFDKSNVDAVLNMLGISEHQVVKIFN